MAESFSEEAMTKTRSNLGKKPNEIPSVGQVGQVKKQSDGAGAEGGKQGNGCKNEILLGGGIK